MQNNQFPYIQKLQESKESIDQFAKFPTYEPKGYDNIYILEDEFEDDPDLLQNLFEHISPDQTLTCELTQFTVLVWIYHPTDTKYKKLLYEIKRDVGMTYNQLFTKMYNDLQAEYTTIKSQQNPLLANYPV